VQRCKDRASPQQVLRQLNSSKRARAYDHVASSGLTAALSALLILMGQVSCRRPSPCCPLSNPDLKALHQVIPLQKHNPLHLPCPAFVKSMHYSTPADHISVIQGRSPACSTHRPLVSPGHFSFMLCTRNEPPVPQLLSYPTHITLLCPSTYLLEKAYVTLTYY